MIAASNFEIFKIAGNEYSFVYNGFASSTGTQIAGTGISSSISYGLYKISHAFVRTDGTEVFTYLPEATNCYDAGPVSKYGPGIDWHEFADALHKFRSWPVGGSKADDNDWQQLPKHGMERFDD